MRKYLVTLTGEERRSLQHLTAAGKASDALMDYVQSFAGAVSMPEAERAA